MSIELLTVSIRCDHCDEVIIQSGKLPEDAAVERLRSKMHTLGWKTVSTTVDGRLQTSDYCPHCSYELGLK